MQRISSYATCLSPIFLMIEKRQEQLQLFFVPTVDSNMLLQVATVPAFLLQILQSFKKNGHRHVAYELILGASWPAQFEYFFSLPAQNEDLFYGPQ